MQYTVSYYSLLLWRGLCLFCGAVVSLPFTVSRDPTLKKLPEKLADFVFNSHRRRDCKQGLDWTVIGSCTEVFQKTMNEARRHRCWPAGHCPTGACVVCPEERGHSQIQGCWIGGGRPLSELPGNWA